MRGTRLEWTSNQDGSTEIKLIAIALWQQFQGRSTSWQRHNQPERHAIGPTHNRAGTQHLLYPLSGTPGILGLPLRRDTGFRHGNLNSHAASAALIFAFFGSAEPLKLVSYLAAHLDEADSPRPPQGLKPMDEAVRGRHRCFPHSVAPTWRPATRRSSSGPSDPSRCPSPR